MGVVLQLQSQEEERGVSGTRGLQQERNWGTNRHFHRILKELGVEMCSVITPFPSPRTRQDNLQDVTVRWGVVFSLSVGVCLEWLGAGAGWERP